MDEPPGIPTQIKGGPRFLKGNNPFLLIWGLPDLHPETPHSLDDSELFLNWLLPVVCEEGENTYIDVVEGNGCQ
jgi:hypothetical protein